MIKIFIWIVIVMLWENNLSIAQGDITSDIPQIGKPVPNFVLDNVKGFSKKKLTDADLKGKWLILDFWTIGCISCIQSFPKLNELQNKFGDDVQFLLVGLNTNPYSSAVEAIYDKLKKKFELKLAAAYDSVLFARWEITSVPHVVIVDPNGIVAAVTTGAELKPDKIEALVNGEQISFKQKGIAQPEYGDVIKANSQLPEDKIIYQAILSKWNGEMQFIPSDLGRALAYSPKAFKVAMAPLYMLYNLAYFQKDSWPMPTDSLYGNVYPEPVVESSDSALFKFNFSYDSCEGLYNYYKMLPSGISRDHLMRDVQSDLKSSFGFEVAIENREMPVWKLISISPEARKLVSRGGKTKISGDGITGLELMNYGKEEALTMLIGYISDNEPPFVDGTGLPGKWNIKIDAVMSDFEDVRRGLREIGLDIVKGTKKMKVLVIRDPAK